jgi:IclR family transcriptional regulator, pca regulon regulatory protein
MAKGKTVPRRHEAMGGLAKGLGVIRAFTRDRAALTLSDIAGITEMPAATARRCLLTLEAGATETDGRCA